VKLPAIEASKLRALESLILTLPAAEVVACRLPALVLIAGPAPMFPVVVDRVNALVEINEPLVETFPEPIALIATDVALPPNCPLMVLLIATALLFAAAASVTAFALSGPDNVKVPEPAGLVNKKSNVFPLDAKTLTLVADVSLMNTLPEVLAETEVAVVVRRVPVPVPRLPESEANVRLVAVIVALLRVMSPPFVVVRLTLVAVIASKAIAPPAVRLKLAIPAPVVATEVRPLVSCT